MKTDFLVQSALFYFQKLEQIIGKPKIIIICNFFMEVIKLTTTSDVENQIAKCRSNGHFQQVVYSVHRMAITQICFGCNKIHTTN